MLINCVLIIILHGVRSGSPPSSALFIGTLSAAAAPLTEAGTATLPIANHPPPVHPDTGAQCNVLSTAILRSLPISAPLQPTSARLIAFDGQHIRPIGGVTLPCISRTLPFSILFHIVAQDIPSTLDPRTIEHLDRPDPPSRHNSTACPYTRYVFPRQVKCYSTLPNPSRPVKHNSTLPHPSRPVQRYSTLPQPLSPSQALQHASQPLSPSQTLQHASQPVSPSQALQHASQPISPSQALQHAFLPVKALTSTRLTLFLVDARLVPDGIARCCTPASRSFTPLRTQSRLSQKEKKTKKIARHQPSTMSSQPYLTVV